MTAFELIARDPRAVLRRGLVALALAALVVVVSASATINVDGPAWVIYATAFVACALAVFQILVPGAGLRWPSRRRTREIDALVAAAVVAGWSTSSRAQQPRLFDVEEAEPVEAFQRAAVEAVRRHEELAADEYGRIRIADVAAVTALTAALFEDDEYLKEVWTHWSDIRTARGRLRKERTEGERARDG